MAPKSIFRQPGAQHFQLVHRSQRDPLIHDPEASQHVLKGFERENIRKGKSRAELESIIPPDELAQITQRANIGEATLYDVFYDDTDYDYMQHLRQVGANEEGIDSVLLVAPKPKQAKGKGKVTDAQFLKETAVVPAEALPSKTELERTYESQLDIPSALAGFQPDMNPHLRQALEALEDEAFVEDDLDEDFFGELVQDGELDPQEDLDYEFDENGLPDEDDEGHEEETEPKQPGVETSWESRFAEFKKTQQTQQNAAKSDDDAGSEGRDTIGGLPQLSVVGGKRRRKGAASDASGYSLSSSSMFRNAGLSTLDEQFAQLEKEYASDDDDDDDDDDLEDDDTEGALSNDDEDEDAPSLLAPREDFDSLMDDFLDKYELVGGKVRPVLEGATGAEKLQTMRNAMVEGLSRADIRDSTNDDDDENVPMPSIVGMGKEQDRWDCETILSTYTNLENHPRMIRAREAAPIARIRLDPRTGLPSVEGADPISGIKPLKPSIDAQRLTLREQVLGADAISQEPRTTITRARDESKEEKKARKQAVKSQRQTRRTEKKIMKETFSEERKHQVKVQGQGAKVVIKKL